MSFAILLSVDKNRISVAPGASVELAITAQNLTTLLDQVSLRIEGIDPAWVQMIPPHLPVFAQGQATARAIISPPRDPARAPAGTYALQVRAASQENAGQEGQAAAELVVQLTGEYRLELERGGGQDPLEKSYPLRVRNEANAPLNLRWAASDAESGLWYKFEPFQVTVAPGGEAAALCTVRAKRAGAEARALTFTITAQGEFTPQASTPVHAPDRTLTGTFSRAAAPRLLMSLEPTPADDPAYGVYQIHIGNPGLTAVGVSLAAEAATGISFQFEPVRLSLPPQSDGRAQLTVRPVSPLAAPVSFRILAQPAGGEYPPASATGLYSPAAVPEPRGGFPWVIVLSGLLGLCLALAVLVILFGPFGR